MCYTVLFMFHEKKGEKQEEEKNFFLVKIMSHLQRVPLNHPHNRHTSENESEMK